MNTLAALAVHRGEAIELRAPVIGVFRAAIAAGNRLTPGAVIGRIDQLGVSVAVVVPEQVSGIVVQCALGSRPLGYGGVLAVLTVTIDEITADASITATEDLAGVVFRAPAGGRFWSRPAADADPFVRVGQDVKYGQTVGLLEVMKTFTRIAYSDPSLPARAKVIEVLVADGDDVVEGAPLFELLAT